MDSLIPNSSVFIQIANFLMLLFILNIILYRPIRGILKKRTEEMTSAKNKTEDLLQKADKFSNEYNENLNTTRKEGMSEKEVAITLFRCLMEGGADLPLSSFLSSMIFQPSIFLSSNPSGQKRG